MANLLNSAFNSLDDDEFLELFGLSLPNLVERDSNISLDSHDDFTARSINMSSEELDLNFDSRYDINITSASKYVTENQFKDMAKRFSPDTFALLHLNIRSINKHFDEFQLLLDNSNKKTFPVIGLTETWLSSDSNQALT